MDCLLRVWAVPRASRSRIVGMHGDALRVCLAAPPVDGEANAELEKLLAGQLGLPRSSVRVEKGTGSRRKQVRLQGLSAFPEAWLEARVSTD